MKPFALSTEIYDKKTIGICYPHHNENTRALGLAEGISIRLGPIAVSTDRLSPIAVSTDRISPMLCLLTYMSDKRMIGFCCPHPNYIQQKIQGDVLVLLPSHLQSIAASPHMNSKIGSKLTLHHHNHALSPSSPTPVDYIAIGTMRDTDHIAHATIQHIPRHLQCWSSNPRLIQTILGGALLDGDITMQHACQSAQHCCGIVQAHPAVHVCPTQQTANLRSLALHCFCCILVHGSEGD
jgi:hypothetical protein